MAELIPLPCARSMLLKEDIGMYSLRHYSCPVIKDRYQEAKSGCPAVVVHIHINELHNGVLGQPPLVIPCLILGGNEASFPRIMFATRSLFTYFVTTNLFTVGNSTKNL